MTASGKRVVVVRVFVKKTQKTPRREIELALAIIDARARVGLTQAQLAERMKTTQSIIARLESGKGRPSTTTLRNLARYWHATGNTTGTRVNLCQESRIPYSWTREDVSSPMFSGLRHAPSGADFAPGNWPVFGPFASVRTS